MFLIEGVPFAVRPLFSTKYILYSSLVVLMVAAVKSVQGQVERKLMEKGILIRVQKKRL
jgi:uncharacterized membrane protein